MDNRIKILGLLLLAGIVGCVPARQSTKRKPERIEVEAGSFIPGYGFSIDAAYDPRLDNVVPGYKLLTVVVRNTSLSVISMDPKKDRWVVIDEKGSKHKGINSLKLANHQRWRSLPEKLRGLIDYPETVPISYTVTFDILFPLKTPLKGFQAIWYKNSLWGQEFRVSKD